MATLDNVRREIDLDELDYPALAAALGEDALPELDALVAEDQPRIASKATYLAALISGPLSGRVVARAARSRHVVIRVSAASALSLLPAGERTAVAERLLADSDVGVRARAAKSAVTVGEPDLTAKVRAMATGDEHELLRQLAAELTANGQRPDVRGS